MSTGRVVIRPADHGGGPGAGNGAGGAGGGDRAGGPGWSQAPPEPMFTTGPARWRSPVLRHRPPGSSRLLALIGALVLLLAVVAAGGAIADQRLDTDDRERPFAVAGEFGEPVSSRTFRLTVLDVRTAAEITDRPGRGHDTAGVWVLVRIRVMASQEVAAIGYASVRDEQGRTWLLSDRVPQPLVTNRYQLQPGIPVEAEIAFEVPEPAATELTLQLAENSFTRSMDAVVEVPLPVDQAMVGQPVPGPVLLAAPEVVIADPQVLVGTGLGPRS